MAGKENRILDYKISFLIPLTSDRIPNSTVCSVLKQACKCFEIIILQNDVSYMPEEMEVREEKLPISYADLLMRKLQIKSKGKGNALNIGIKHAQYDFVCVVDADCILDDCAIQVAMQHFEDENVSVVGAEWWFEMTVSILERIGLSNVIPQMWGLYLLYLGFELSLTCIAEYLEHGRWWVIITKLPEAVAATALGILLSVPLAVARLWGMISFPWRRLEW